MNKKVLFTKPSFFNKTVISFFKNGGILFFMIIFSFSSFSQVIQSGDWSSVRLYGHAYSLNNFTTPEYDFIKNHNSIFTIEKRHAKNIYGAVSSETGSKVAAAQIISNNGSAKPLFYWNTKVVYDDIYQTIKAAVALHPEWTNSTGGDWTYADPEFRTWFVDVVKDQVNNQGHSGVFLDGALSVGGSISKTASNFLVYMMDEMPGIVIFNGFGPNTPYARFDFLEHADGVFVEHFFKSQCNSLAKGKKMLDDLLLVPSNKIIIANACPESTFWNTTNHKFSLAAYLIIANENSYYHYFAAENYSNTYMLIGMMILVSTLGLLKGQHK